MCLIIKNKNRKRCINRPVEMKKKSFKVERQSETSDGMQRRDQQKLHREVRVVVSFLSSASKFFLFYLNYTIMKMLCFKKNLENIHLNTSFRC